MNENDRFEQRLEQLPREFAREAIVTTFSGASAAMIGFAVGGLPGLFAGTAVGIAVRTLSGAAVDRYQSVPNPGGLDLFRSDKDLSVKFLGSNENGEKYNVDGVIVSVDYETCELSIKGTSKSDTITGCKRSDDYLYGEAGSDRLSGQNGNDHLFGATGNDRLWGDGGSDTLRGEAGSNTVYGGVGNDNIYVQNKGSADEMDSLYGGGQKDDFIFYKGSRAKINDFDRDDSTLIWRDGSEDVSDIKFYNVVIDVDDRTTSSGKDFGIRSVDLLSKNGTRVHLRDTDGHVFKDHVTTWSVSTEARYRSADRKSIA